MKNKWAQRGPTAGQWFMLFGVIGAFGIYIVSQFVPIIPLWVPLVVVLGGVIFGLFIDR